MASKKEKFEWIGEGKNPILNPSGKGTYEVIWYEDGQGYVSKTITEKQALDSGLRVKQNANVASSVVTPATPATSASPKPSPSPGPTKSGSTGGTLSPRAQEEIALRTGQSSGGSSKTSKGIITGVSRGQDAEGNPITGVIYKPGFEQSYIKNLPPEARIAFQKKMFEAGLYPKNFAPTFDGMVTPEDFVAVAKLVAVGEQKGMGDINAVLGLSKTDKKVAAYLKTGGYTPTSTGPILTDTKEAKSNLNDFFLNLFNEKPSDAEVKAYQSALNAREKTVKGGMTAQERDDIIMSIANKRLSNLTSMALTGDVLAADKLDEGQLGKRVREIRAQYDENGIPVSNRTVYNLAGKSFRSPEAWDTIQDDINRNAAMQWGKAAEGLKPGQTVRARLQPYITIRSQIRNVPEEQIKTQDMTDVMNPDGTLKNVNEYKAVQYKSDDYLGSDTYKSTVLNDTRTVLRNFGVM